MQCLFRIIKQKFCTSQARCLLISIHMLNITQINRGMNTETILQLWPFLCYCCPVVAAAEVFVSVIWLGSEGSVGVSVRSAGSVASPTSACGASQLRKCWRKFLICNWLDGVQIFPSLFSQWMWPLVYLTLLSQFSFLTLRLFSICATVTLCVSIYYHPAIATSG